MWNCPRNTSRHINFYPRPPRGGRLLCVNARYYKSKISIHALREEGDHEVCLWYTRCAKFLSTPSARRATRSLEKMAVRRVISIHALREEGDGAPQALPLLLDNFYPRPPRGGRPMVEDLPEEWTEFLSTPSARRATAKTERKHPAFVSLYTSLHKLQRDVCKSNRKITPLLAQMAGILVRSVPENHVRCRFALAGHQKISTLSCANSGCSPTCSTLVW